MSAADCDTSRPSLGSARARRERRRRAEARLRWTLVRDGFVLASHRGCPAQGSWTTRFDRISALEVKTDQIQLALDAISQYRIDTDAMATSTTAKTDHLAAKLNSLDQLVESVRASIEMWSTEIKRVDERHEREVRRVYEHLKAVEEQGDELDDLVRVVAKATSSSAGSQPTARKRTKRP